MLTTCRISPLVCTALALGALLSVSPAAQAENYLILTAADYEGSAPLNQFVAAKSSQGFDVLVHAIDAGMTNEQVRAYVESLWGTLDAPDYLLLIGDTDGAVAGDNTIPHWPGVGTEQAPTDLYYACMGGPDDWWPDMYYGRFSVRDLSQLQAMVDKTLYVEAGNYADPGYAMRTAFLAGDDPDAYAEQTHDALIADYFDPVGCTTERIYYPFPSGDGRQEIFDAVDNGVFFLTYMGHSTSMGWWAPAFNLNNVEALANADRYPLVFSLSCNTANYTMSECFGEKWVRQVDKGAVAYLSASDYVGSGSVQGWESTRRVEEYFFECVFEEDQWVLGKAWRGVLDRFLADPDYGPTHETTLNIFEQFIILGDPALRMPQPYPFILDVPVATESICNPPDTTAQFDIDVLENLGATEAVTLSVSGLPAGATHGFSANGLVPPFTSTLTVGNLGAVASGHYVLEVAGISSGGATRSKELLLAVSGGLPGTVALVDPPDAATDVLRTPALTWQAATDAVEYDVQISQYASFMAPVYTATVADTSHEVEMQLEPSTEYFWRVRAANGCGAGTYSPGFSFTTLSPADFFTEEFSGSDPLDLSGKSALFTPDGSGNFYAACVDGATEFPTDPAGGATLNLSDDGTLFVWPTSAPMQALKIYGTEYAYGFYVNSNGNVTFDAGDATYTGTLDGHFQMQRVSGLYADLNPSAGGTVSWKDTGDLVAVTFENVPEAGTGNLNTFQIELLYNGDIRLTWLDVSASEGIAGLSEGIGVPAEYVESDMSGFASCSGVVPGDTNCDGLITAGDIDPFIMALTDEAAYQVAYPNCDLASADCNGDGLVNAGDIDPFVAILVGP